MTKLTALPFASNLAGSDVLAGVQAAGGRQFRLSDIALFIGAASVAGVSSFNGRTGAVALTGGDVTSALGFTPQVSGSYLTANQAITLSGDVTGSGSTAIAVAIGANKVTRAMLAAAASATLLGATAAGNVADLTPAQAKTVLAIAAGDVSGLAAVASTGSAADLTGTLGAARLPAFSGDVTTSAGAAATTIAGNAVTFSKLVAATAAGIVGATAAGNFAQLTPAQVKSVLALTASDVSGLAASATTDTTNAGNINSGTLSALRMPAMTGDVTATAGSHATTIAANAVTFSKFVAATAAGLVGATGSGNFAQLTAAQAKTVLAITEADVANLTTDLAAKASLASPQFTGVSFYQQGAPTAVNASATLTIAQLLSLIITTTSTVAVSLTLPTGTLTDAGILSGALAVNEAFEWYIINLGSSSGAVTIAAGTGHTVVGSVAVAIGTSARFLTRKTAANTFVTYRIA